MPPTELVLDLFCGAGGAAMGYAQAGFDVIGVDIDPQPAYPFTFWRIDAITLMTALLNGKRFAARGEPDIGLDDIDFIHASPPCQDYTALKAVHGNTHPRLIEPIRTLLQRSGKAWVIENVQGAPLRRDMTLCGEMFGLGVIRHRYFELGNWAARAPEHVPHRGRVRGWRHGEYFDGPYVAVHGAGGGKATVEEARNAMGIEHMTSLHDLTEAIPPAYTRYIAQQWRTKHGVQTTTGAHA